jgi:DNA-binding LacI/PurR family transcriptional regulator
MGRPTIADIAQRVGLTKAAVSLAINGQPGVSAATRERILAVAKEIGFQPSSAARALTVGRAGAFGLVIDRPARTLGIEQYFPQLISGIQAGLAGHPVTLLFTVAENADDEIDMYRQWWGQGRVDGVIVVDLQVNDRRVGVLEELSMPAVVVGTPRGSGSLPAVWQNDRAAVETVIGHLAGLGHQRIARVGGFGKYWHSALRAESFSEVAAEAGLHAVTVAGDYSAGHAAAATRELLAAQRPPTAILYDSDVMAIAGLGMAQRLGVSVPSGLSIVSWDDSALCELIHPTVTALSRDIAAAGAMAAHMLRELVAGRTPGNFGEPPPELVVRGSSGPAGVPAVNAAARGTRQRRSRAGEPVTERQDLRRAGGAE